MYLTKTNEIAKPELFIPQTNLLTLYSLRTLNDQKPLYKTRVKLIRGSTVSDQTLLETEQDPPPSGEVDNITMDTESVTASDDGREEEEKGQSNQPMDLGSPLDSDPEFDLLPVEQDDSMDMTGKEGGDDADETVEKEKEPVEEEAEEEGGGGGEKEEETEEDKEEPGEKEKEEEEEEKAKEGNEKRLDRLDSTFDSSYEPATEELLYEGDPDTDVKQETSEGPAAAGEEEQPSSQDKEDDGEGDKMADTSATEKREEDEGFMVEVHYKDQGGSLEDPAATVIGPAPSSSSRMELREKGGKASLSSGGKTTGDSNRFVLPCRFFPPFSLHSTVYIPIGAHSVAGVPIGAHCQSDPLVYSAPLLCHSNGRCVPHHDTNKTSEI